jgi:putative DNA primase/helicase
MEEIEQFKLSMMEAGITPPESIIPDGALHRFKIDGKLNGWYSLHLDGRAAGSFGDWKQGIKQKWKLNGDFKKFTEEERKAFAAQRATEEISQKREEETRHAEAAKKACYIWANARPATSHPYLTLKKIKPHSLKVGRDNTLIIPVINAKDELVNLQFIGADGSKRFLSGGQKKGCFYRIGALTDNSILIAEGFATAASLYEATGHFALVAFDAGNLEDTAKVAISLYPRASIIIMADNDRSFIGQDKARAAALAVGGKYVVCPIVGMDFNDYLNQGVTV